jgi:hypothetical protein
VKIEAPAFLIPKLITFTLQYPLKNKLGWISWSVWTLQKMGGKSCAFADSET